MTKEQMVAAEIVPAWQLKCHSVTLSLQHWVTWGLQLLEPQLAGIARSASAAELKVLSKR